MKRRVLGEGQLSKCLSPKPLNQWLENVSPLAKAQAAACAILTFRCKLVCSLQKKLDQSQCVFSDPAHQQRNVLIPKLGQGILAVSAPRELCTKRRVTIAQTLSFCHLTLGDFALSGTDGSVPVPRLGSCLETLVEGYRINTWRVKGFESVHTLLFNAQHFQGGCSLSVCPHRSPQM